MAISNLAQMYAGSYSRRVREKPCLDSLRDEPLQRDNYLAFRDFFRDIAKESQTKMGRRLKRVEDFVRTLPYLHVGSVKDVESVLHEGSLVALAYRESKGNQHTHGHFAFDRELGLDRFTFMTLGKRQDRGNPNSNVTYIIKPQLYRGIFTWHDISILLDDEYFLSESARHKSTTRPLSVSPKAIAKYDNQIMPTFHLPELMAYVLCMECESPEEFLEREDISVHADTFDKTFRVKLEPEIKLDTGSIGLTLDNVIGFLVDTEDTRKRLIALGVNADDIILSGYESTDDWPTHELKTDSARLIREFVTSKNG